jgi:transcriptional regulator with XRE-family HTH domain
MVAKQDVPALNPRAIREAMRISREQMGRLFDVSPRTVERWEARGDGPSNRHLRAIMLQLHEIADLGLGVYTPEGFELFLKTPLPVFEGRTALEMIEDGHADLVFGELAADYEGLGF